MGRFHSSWSLDKLNASIHLRNAVGYWRDLRAFRQGDVGRFERMVDSHGSKFPLATPAEWERRIWATTQDIAVRLYFARRCDVLLTRTGEV